MNSIRRGFVNIYVALFAIFGAAIAYAAALPILADANADGTQAVQDMLNAHGSVLVGIVGVLVLLIPIVLKVLGKEIPFLDPILEAVLDLAKKIAKKDAPPPPPTDGVSNVVDLKEVKPEDKGPQP